PPSTLTLSLHDALPICRYDAPDGVRPLGPERDREEPTHVVRSALHGLHHTSGIDFHRERDPVERPDARHALQGEEDLRTVSEGRDRKSTRLNSSHVKIS